MVTGFSIRIKMQHAHLLLWLIRALQSVVLAVHTTEQYNDCNICKCNFEERSVDCSNKKLKRLPRELPANITKLILYDCELQELKDYELGKLYKQLVILDIRNNKIAALRNVTFAGLDELQYIDMGGNEYKADEIDPYVFSPLPNIREIIARDYGAITNHKIDRKVSKAWLNTFQGLENSKIEKITFDGISKSPVFLKMEELRYLQNTPLKQFTLYNSRVVDIDIEAFNYIKKVEEIDLSLNSLQMEIDYVNAISLLFTLSKLRVIKVSQNSRNFNAKVHEVFPECIAGMTIRIPYNIEFMAFSSSTLTRGPCSFSYGLNLDNNNSIRFLDFQGMKMIDKLGPVTGLVNVQFLYANNMGCEIYPSTISCQKGAFESIEILDLSQNFFNMTNDKLNKTIEMFVNCTRLRDINLSDNRMSKMPFTMFRHSSQLRRINLSGNNLKEFNVALESASHLESLDISNNDLQSLPENIQNIIETLNKNSNVTVKVDMLGNPLICGCNSLDFLDWMQRHNKNIAVWWELKCTHFNGSIVKMYAIDLSEMRLSCWKPIILAGIVPSGMMLMLGCLLFFIYKGRYKIHYLYLQLRAALRQHGKGNDDYDFDAFISYSSLDKTWGLETLYATLVGIHHYSICVDDRNFRPGAYISDIILDAINRSNKVILVITQNFLRSKWCTYEMKIARGELANRGRDCLVLILKEPIHVIPKELITPTLQSLLDTRVYLEWNDDADRQAVFWRKLCDALGDPRPLNDQQGGSQYTMPQNEEDEQLVQNFLRDNRRL